MTYVYHRCINKGMSETLRIKYTQNAEWVMARTGDDYYGDLALIKSKKSDIRDIVPPVSEEPIKGDIIDLSERKGWSPIMSTHGSFEIFIPKPAYLRLASWTLELYGLPRMYSNLKMDAVADLFGPELPTYLELIHSETARFHESAGDLQVTEAVKGLRTTAEMQEEDRERMQTIITEVQDLTPEVMANRQALIDGAKSKQHGSLLVVDRTVFFKR